MTTTHNQGRLRVGTQSSTLISDKDGPGVRGYDDPSYGGYLVAESIHPTNAPRLAACWNACQGFSTEVLESADLHESAYDAEGRQFELTQQRDNLLSLLSELMDTELADLACAGSNSPVEDLLGRIKAVVDNAAPPEPEPEPLPPPPPPPICTKGCDYQQNGSGRWICARCFDWLPF